MLEIILRLKAIIAGISALLLVLAPISPDFRDDIVLGNAIQTKRDWNAKTISKTIGDKQENTTQFHIKWIHWLDEGNQWKIINTDFATSTDGTKFVMLNAPFKAEAPLRSTGVAKMINDNRWNVFDKKEITEAPLTMSISAFDITDVAGKLMTGDLNVPTGIQKNVSYVLYKNAYPEGDLIYYVDFGRAPRFEKLVRINSAPTKFSYAFSLFYDAKVNFGQTVAGQKRVWNENEPFVFDKEKSIEVKKDGSTIRGNGIAKVQVWDSATPTRKKEVVDVSFQKTGQNTFTFTKNLTSAFFTGVTYPVYTDITTKFFPDPNVEVTSVDGFVARTAVTETWGTIRVGAGTSADDASAIFEHYARSAASTDNWQAIVRPVHLYDTSSIADGNTIDAATSSLFQGTSGAADNFDFAVSLATSTPASNTALVSGDYSQIGQIKQSNDVDITNFVASTYHNFEFKSTKLTAIDKTGITKLAYRFDKDITGTTTIPTWVSSTNGGWTGAADSLISSDTAGTDKDPRLTVVHTSVAAPKNNQDEELLQLLFNTFRLNTAWAI